MPPRAGSGGAKPGAGKPAARSGGSRAAAKPAPGADPFAILKAAESGEFPGSVYLDGPDDAVKTAFLSEYRRLWAAAVPEAALARVLHAGEAGVDPILAAYQNVSLFAPRELTIVFDIEDLGRSEKRVQILADGLATPSQGSSLVLVESPAETVRKTMAPLRAACAVCVEAAPPSERALIEWGLRKLTASGHKAEPGVLNALLDACERDPIAFLNEAGKLAVLAGDGGTVTAAHVKTIIAPTLGSDMPEYLMAVASGDTRAATVRLERLLAEGENEGGVLWALGHLATSALAKSANNYAWAKWPNATAALGRRRDPGSLARAVDAVYRAEAAWKGGRSDARAALEQATREVAAR
ncbi:MAG: hypothetical protein K8R56_09270 [Candidatus Eisenbacteria bacterium]|nr:hypothetical protein [Candidatus Eisenbacteria bacterium]